MATAQGLKRTLILPIIAGGLVLATIGGYYAVQYASAGSKPAAVEVKPAPTLEERVTPVAVAPQIIEKPATLQEIGGIEGITKDYITQVAKWAGQELGYPMDARITINLLSESDYADQVSKTPNSHIIRNSIGFVSPDGMNVYIKATVEPYKLVGLVLNETGKAQIGYLLRQNKVVMPSKELRLEISETAAFAYQAATQKYLEEKLGFENFFIPPDYYDVKDLTSQFAARKRAYQQDGDVTLGGFLMLWYAVLNEPQLSDLSEHLMQHKSLTYEQQIKAFMFLLRQDDSYARASIEKIGEKDFETMAEVIVARKGNPQFQLWNYYDDMLP